ncbi:hypothetical protein GGR50DRAFT_171875 [Xylaria sp. CBS 124048]|nr:hypothetical protein GGR50DRAFT_171875 [Xylaria sp. CBS 124048]
MSTTDKATRPQAPSPLPSTSRPLFKGTLSPPYHRSTCTSYTLTPASISEVMIKDPGKPVTSMPCSAILGVNHHPPQKPWPSDISSPGEFVAYLHHYALAGPRHTAISSRAVPQPFVDPAILQRQHPPSA